MKKKTKNSCQQNTSIDTSEFRSFINNAHEVEQDIEAVARLLKEKYINTAAYSVDTKLSINMANIKEIFVGSNDIHSREFIITPANVNCGLVYVESMADQSIINGHIIEKLTLPPLSSLVHKQDDLLHYLKQTLITAASVTDVSTFDQAVKRILSGDTALFIDGLNVILIIATRKVDARAIGAPETETDTRGPRDGFTEELRVNITLIRRRIKNPNLVVKRLTIGVRSATDVAIVYYRGIVDIKLVCKVEQRLKKLDVDIPAGSGIEGMIEDHIYSPFPTMLTTERPDRMVLSLSRGKVGIIIDGSPFCLIAPATLTDFFHTVDDYYQKWLPAALIRFTRYAASFFALALPALYVAFTAFHPAFLPTPLALTIGISREGVPFPAFIEALLMVSLLEIMQEAGIRMPKTVGPAVSIVGGLVIGDSAVRAGLVSASLIIVTAFTAIASFNIVNYNMGLSIRLLRVPLMMFGASFGLFGVVIGLLLIAIHLSKMESFGEPYVAPLTPINLSHIRDLKDTIVVLPPDSMDERPGYLEPADKKKQNNKFPE